MSDSFEPKNPFSNIFDAPSSSKNIPMRPLNKGMVRTVSPQMLPEGSFYTVSGCIITQNGPQRRPGWQISGGGASLDISNNGTIWDMFTFITSSIIETLVITNSDLWRFDFQSGFTSITGGSGCFNGDKIYNIDRTIVPTSSGYSAVFADSFNNLKEYNGSEVTTFSTYATNPRCVEYFENRLFVGAPDDTHPNRIIWTNLGDSTDFDVSNYFDFLEEQDGIQAIKGLGNLLIVYFPKSIYFGRPTNRVDLPFSFTRLETGNIGLVGKKAVAKWDDGHFFIGQDDVYFFSASNSLTPLNCPVIEEMVRSSDQKEKAYAVADPLNEVVIFGMPGSNNNIETVWFYHYKSRAWSYSPIDASCLASIGTYVSRQWGDSTMTLDGTTIDYWEDEDASDPSSTSDFNDAGFDTWKSMESHLSLQEVFMASDNEVFKFEELKKQDHFGPIEVVLESGDFDLGIPDTNKCMNRLSMKVNKIMDQEIVFSLWTSNNRGKDWDYKGDLIIPQDEDEGKVDFRSYGSTFRFELVSVSQTDQYTINEIIMRGRARGLEV